MRKNIISGCVMPFLAILEPFRGSEYTKKASKHCSQDGYGSFSTFKGAESNCNADSNCQGVYDTNCDGLGPHYLCPLNAKLDSSNNSCVYTKTQGNCSFK